MFIGLCYRFISYGFSNLMLYFLVQALSSLNIFVFYSLSFDFAITFFLFLKLAVFPFYGWFPLAVSKMTNFMFFLVSTFQKFPSVVLFYRFVTFYFTSLFVFFLMSTILVSSLFMFNTYSFRLLLSFSSVGGNSWFLLSSLCGFDFFLVFFLIYTLNFFLVISFLGNSFKPNLSIRFSYYIMLFSCFISIGGFPPFPPFFIKLYIIYFMSFYSFFSFSFVLFFLVLVVYMLSSYIRYSLSNFINIFSRPLCFVLYITLLLFRFGSSLLIMFLSSLVRFNFINSFLLLVLFLL